MNMYVPLWTLIHTIQKLSPAVQIIMHIMKTECYFAISMYLYKR